MIFPVVLIEVPIALMAPGTLLAISCKSVSYTHLLVLDPFVVKGKTYAFRCAADTVSGLPMYFNWRVFELTGIRFDNFTTKGSSTSVCEVIMTGVFKRPQLASAKAYAIRQPEEDGSDIAACDAWLTAAETLPKA